MSAALFFGQKHKELRQHARGADIALLADGDTYLATMECAARCRKTAGTLGVWKDLGEGAQEIRFPLPAMYHVLTVLSQRHSVALMERTPQIAGQFRPSYTTIWVVQRPGEAEVLEEELRVPDEDFNDLLD